MATASKPERPKFRRPFLEPKILDELIELLPDGPSTDVLDFLKNVRLEPRQAEAQLLQRIEEAADLVIADLFGPADRALEKLRVHARVVEMQDFTANISVPAIDAETGGVHWKTDESGYVLDWSRVDGMDIEACVLALDDAIQRATTEVGRLHGRAAMAYQVKEDEYWDAYRRGVGGTINDNTAAAHRGSKDARYYFFAMWTIWDRANAKLEAVKQSKRDLEFLRSRLVKEAEPSRYR